MQKGLESQQGRALFDLFISTLRQTLELPSYPVECVPGANLPEFEADNAFSLVPLPKLRRALLSHLLYTWRLVLRHLKDDFKFVLLAHLSKIE
jgi:hypothetical protein